MKKFLEIIGIDQEKKLTVQERCMIFADKARSDEGWLANVIIQFLQYQKERVNRKEITGSTVRNYVNVMKLFCEMNDLLVPWKKLTRGLPKARNYADDRVPRLDELQKIIKYPARPLWLSPRWLHRLIGKSHYRHSNTVTAPCLKRLRVKLSI
jgi:hypothetical protein